MKFNIKKISAIATSVLLAGMTMGVAAAANYPLPFVAAGTADVAIVYGTGTGVSSLDVVEAGNIQANLQSQMGAAAGAATTTSITGEAVSLDTSSQRIWLNSSLNSAKSSLGKSELPTVLADYTFSGNVDAKLTSTIKPMAGSASGKVNSGKLYFGKQPSSSDDPVMGITLGASTVPLYNATFTCKAIEFNNSDSEGETIHLFGKDFVVSTATDGDTLVLFSSAEEVTLISGGSSPVTSATVTIGETDYTIGLVTGTSDAATISVNDGTTTEQKSITEGSSKKINGIEVAVKSTTESTALSTLTTTILVGSEKLTFEPGTTVTKGSDDDPIDGTKVYIGGTAGMQVATLTELTIAVFKPSTSKDAILEGEPFIDPVFGSFKVDYQGLSIPLEDAAREDIIITNSGEKTMTLSMTDSGGYAKTFDFAYNKSGTFNLSDENNYKINVREMANLSQNEFVMVGTDDYGHLLQVTRIYNSTAGYTNDVITFSDVFGAGGPYSVDFTSECTGVASCGTLTVDGKEYAVSKGNDGDEGWVMLKYPTSDSLATSGMVVFPTMETANGAKIALVEPLYVNLSGFDGTNRVTKLYFPDGDGYGSAVTVGLSSTNNVDGALNWTINGVSLPNITGFVTNVTVGDVSYYFKRVLGGKEDGTSNNMTIIGVKNITGNSDISDITAAEELRAGVLMFEGKNDDNEYKVIYVDLEKGASADSTNPVGVHDVLFSDGKSAKAYYTATLASDSDIEKEVDWYGTLVISDVNTASQKTVTIKYPKSQVYGKVYIGEESAAISTTTITTAATQLGNVLVTDSEVSSVADKNLIVVGGSCINSAAASLVGGDYCGAGWTEQTNVGSGEFLIKGYATSDITSKLALLVAGYDAADTVNAATYLRTKAVDTSKEYIGTSSTSATLVTTETA